MNRLFFLALLLFHGSCLHAVELPDPEKIEQRIEELKNSENPPDTRDTELSLLNELRQNLAQNKQSTEDTARFRQELKNAPTELAGLEKKLAAPPEEQAGDHASRDTREIEQKLNTLQARQNEKLNQIAELSGKLKQRAQRQANLPSQLALAREELSNFSLPPEPLVSASRSEQLNYQIQLAKRQSLESQVSELTVEQEYLNATADLVDANLELVKKEASWLEKNIKAWKDALAENQNIASEEARRTAAEQAERFQHVPALARITRENTQLAQLGSDLIARSNDARQLEKNITVQQEQTRAQRRSAQERLALLERARLRIDTATAALLRRQRSQLPTPRALKDGLKENIRKATEAQVELLEINKRIENLPESDPAAAAEIYAKLGSDQVIRSEITVLLKQRRDLLHKIDSDYQLYTKALQDVNRALNQTLDEVQTYSLYLDKRLLWIPSASSLSLRDPQIESSAILRFATRNVPRWFQSLLGDALQKPVLWAAAILIFILLFLRRKNARKRLGEIRGTVSQRSCTSILPTFAALAYTLLLSIPPPLLLGFLVWRGQSHEAVSQGLLSTSFFLLFTDILRRLCHRNGILSGHFPFKPEKTAHFHFHLSWFIPLMSPLILLTFALPRMQGPPEPGRLSFIASMLVIATFGHLVFRPSKKLVEPGGRFRWLPKLIHILVLAIPLVYITGTSLGYMTSIYTLREKLATSIWIFLLVGFITHFFLRWILLSRRRLAREQAIKKYEALIAKKNKNKNTSKTQTQSMEEIQASAVNVVQVEAQTTRLVRVIGFVVILLGLWGTWSTTLPALSVLDNVTLWGGGEKQTTEQSGKPADISSTLLGKPAETNKEPAADNGGPAEKSSAAADDNTETSANSGISLQDLLVTFFIIALTISAAGNLPGLLELSLLRKIDLKPGSNYAITTVMRYLIIAIGLVIAFGHVGITWSSVQWLAAAITLGIGFGLQEIFANFVAGIILLFERPIRLGDLVTVGEVSGTVTQIQIRATTILQFNNRELLVPNKEFITGQLVNWTLRSTILRFELPVGIAYGSNTKLATEILNDLITKHPRILKSPAPDVLFTAFGPSTLDFTIRAFVASPDYFLSTQSELHYQIDNAFREVDIDIAIPQRDIFIKSLPEKIESSAFFNKNGEPETT